MREIKFRGKDCSDQWVYGDLIHKRHTKESVLIQDYTGLGSDVDIITIGQYTGLKDKNGKEIYEGDIIFSNKCDGRAILHKVEYNEENAMFVVKPIQGFDFDFCQIHQSWIDKYGKYVIGNIYDNPELIKRKEK